MLAGVVAGVCGALAPLINRRPSETECFLKYRGGGAAAAMEVRRRDDGALAVGVPLGSEAARVVSEFARLGAPLRLLGVAGRTRSSSGPMQVRPITLWRLIGQSAGGATGKLGIDEVC